MLEDFPPELKAYVEAAMDRIGRDEVNKGAIATKRIGEACIGVRADIAMAAMTYSLGQLYHAAFATQGISKPDFMKMVIDAIDKAVDWGPNQLLREHLDKTAPPPDEEASSNGTPNPNSPWR